MADTKNNSFFLLLGRFTSRRGFSRSNRLFIFILLSFFIFISDYFELSYVSYLKNCSISIVIPIKIFANKLIEVPKVFYHYIDLKNENKELRFELDKLKLKTIINSGMEAELSELRQLINLRYQSDSFEFMEKILGFDGSIYDSFLLISNTQPSTKKDSVVVSSNALIGIVFDVYGKFARVLPITNSKIFIPVKNEVGEHLILKGTGKNELSSIEIQSSITKYFKINEILYTSGEGGIYKAGIPVAEITKIDIDKTKIYAKPIANLNILNYAWVMYPLV